MNKEIIEKQLGRIQFLENRILEQNFKVNKPHLLWGQCVRLFSDKSMYMLNLQPTRVTEAKKMLFKAARGAQFEWWTMTSGYSQFKHTGGETITGHFFSNYSKFVLCDHKELFLHHYREVHNYAIENNPPSNAHHRIANAFFSLVAGDVALAKKLLLIPFERDEGRVRSVGYVLNGIIRKDVKLCNKGIQQQIKWHTKINGDIFDYDPNCTALAKLALMYDMDVDTSHYLIHKGMLEFEKLEYEDIDEYYKELGVEPISRVGLKNY